MVGASGRTASLGEWSLNNLLRGGYAGDIYPVNPGYEELQGLRCYASLDDVPEVPELVIFAVGDQNIEASLDQAIAAGVPAAVIMSTLVLDDDDSPVLRDRVRAKIESAGMLVCGANGMGFYNVRDHVWACGFDSAMHAAPGNVALISHSGSGMSGLIDCDERLRINFAVSTGNELSVAMDEYLDFVLDLPETRAVGLFIETARNPAGFRAALEKAAQRRVPIVALKVGRTEESARLTVSHSGAMAGDDAAYAALFDCYGVQRVYDMDELATTLILFAELHPVGEGDLVSLHDSGGERQLMVDLADDAGVPLTRLTSETVAALEEILDPELPAVNPLDAWSRGGPDAGQQMTRSLTAMLQDTGAALGAVIHDRAPDGKIYTSYLGYMQRAHAESGKPVALVAARQGTGYDEAVVTSTHAGFPVVDGVPVFLKGVRALFAYRDFLLQDAGMTIDVNVATAAQWLERLRDGGTFGEAEALGMLADFGLATTPAELAMDERSLLAAAARVGFPLALKTAARGVVHKLDQSGVVLGIETEERLLDAYADISSRLGPEVTVATMADEGIEMLLGSELDPQFGPVVLIGFGGIYAEMLQDITFALPPFSAQHARRCVDRLKLRPMLDGVRGTPAADVDSFCEVAATFSAIVDVLRDVVSEVDVNPVIVHKSGCTIVDALIVAN
ncbi:MAG: acetate--CoA ligase family protein [Gammaproteobacteria bacterium]|nr:acetate--CoA ligase family protein [Gammaproteobacteria bacterium]